MYERSYIGLIGGGASAISFINEITNVNKNNKKHIVIYLFEKSDYLGPGNAYGPRDFDSNILNTKAGYITAIKDSVGDFYKWYMANLNELLVEFPNVYGKDDYVPRALFGKYMKHTFRTQTKHALLNGIQVVTINAEVIDILKNGLSYRIKTACGGEYEVMSVVLACGTLKADRIMGEDKTIFNDPYPVRHMVNAIPKSSDVAIIGARLGAIDATINLFEAGHEGKVKLFSRSGLFPWVRGTQGRYECKYLTEKTLKELIDSLTRPLKLADLATLFLRELENYGENNPDQKENLKFPPDRISDLRKHLEDEITLADGPRGWQAIIYNTNSFLSMAWNALDEVEKNYFFKELLSPAISMRVSIPKENAIKILNLIESGKLEFYTGSAEVNSVGHKHIIQLADSFHKVDYVIKAMGSPRYIEQTNSTLFKNLLKRKIIRQHEFGGVDISTDNKVIDDSGLICEGLYATGEITNGVNLFTSAMDIVCRQAAVCARSCHEGIVNYEITGAA